MAEPLLEVTDLSVDYLTEAGDVRAVRSRYDIESAVRLIHWRQTDPDRDPGTKHRMTTALTVLVPRQTRQAFDGVEPLQQALGSDVREVFAERVAGPVPVAEELTDREKSCVGHKRAQRR